MSLFIMGILNPNVSWFWRSTLPGQGECDMEGARGKTKRRTERFVISTLTVVLMDSDLHVKGCLRIYIFICVCQNCVQNLNCRSECPGRKLQCQVSSSVFIFSSYKSWFCVDPMRLPADCIEIIPVHCQEPHSVVLLQNTCQFLTK